MIENHGVEYIKKTISVGRSEAVIIPHNFLDKQKLIQGKPVFHVAKFGNTILLQQIDKNNEFAKIRGELQ